MATVLTEDVLNVLKGAACDGGQLRITQQLDRNLYVKVNKALEAIGGKWDRKAKAHLFDGEASELVGDIISSGRYVSPRDEYEFFETPASLVDQLIREATEKTGSLSGLRALEPSAGLGAIALKLRAQGAVVSCVEINPKMAESLQGRGFDVRQEDFLNIDPYAAEQFDVVIMNPPFSKSQDIKHVLHAYKHVKPGGVLVSVMGFGWTFREDRRAIAFRAWAEAVDAKIVQCDDGAFKESGTMVRTVYIVVVK